MKQQSCNCLVVFSMFGLDGGLAGDVGALYLSECLLVWVVIWPCFVKQVVVPRITPKVVISLLEASKRSGGLLRALTCYLFYLHLKNSDPQLIQYDLIDCALVSLLYILYGSMWISMFSIYGSMMLCWWNGVRPILYQEKCVGIYMVCFFFIWHFFSRKTQENCASLY